MDIKEVTERIKRAETELSVNDICIRGIEIWPILRYHALLSFKSVNYLDKPNTNSFVHQSFFKRIVTDFLIRREIKKLRSVLHENNCKTVVISNGKDHSDLIQGKKFNRLTDPYIKFLKDEKQSVKKIVIEENVDVQNFYESTEILNLGKLLFYFVKFSKKHQIDKDLLNACIPFDRLEDILGIKYNKAKLARDIEMVLVYSKIFEKLFVDSSVTSIFYTCYYRNELFGLNYATKKLKITTVDIQHGKQGIYHPMYSHFSSIPVNGYLVLPDYFWNWGQSSVENINHHRINKNKHLPLCGGNLFTAMFIQDSENENDQLLEFKKKLKSFSKKILVALQPPIGGKAIPDFLLKAIENSPKDWIWLLRKHPAYELTELALIDKSKENVETELANSMPLYSLIKECDVTITRWSTVAYEAEMFNNRVIIIDPVGQNLYRNEIEEGIFYYTIQSDEILSMITDGKRIESKLNFISTDIEDAKQALKKIVDHG